MKNKLSVLLVCVFISFTGIAFADESKNQALSIESLFLTLDDDDTVQPTTTVGDATSSCNMYGSTQVCLTVSPRGSCARVSTPSGSHTIGDNC